MSKIIESRFRVFNFDNDDIQLNDLAGGELPVYVNRQHEQYSTTLQSKIEELEPGNVIEAEIKSESITQQDDTWIFIDLEVTDETRFHFIENADNHTSHAEVLAEKAQKVDGVTRKGISSNGDRIGFLTASPDKGEKFWRRLQDGLNSHEYDLRNLEEIDEPPYEVIYTRTSDEKSMIFYHFSNRDTKPAKAVLSANS
ncbi:hypothetical protein [Natrinema sp. 1APR25-10V2]|uniref:hypothetical protein n=1 Tax=Natrinema sp. 1APR25-10V2 TaxID=2951081 RepID=UPI0028763889|nr:hypothetical protein [Natrinema sp. 1APR25-10V2]MDS0474590.1 hypothetical protein [Natrinema sp. 1APR25-10V2]